MYTSGTTGKPKGALLSYRKIFFNSLNAVSFLELSRDDVMLIVQPLFHSGGLLIQHSYALHAELTVKRLARYKCPTRYVFLRDLPRTASGKVRKVELLKAL